MTTHSLQFFQAIEGERTWCRLHGSRNEARQDMVGYIEMFYNPKDRYGINSTLSLIKYEMHHFDRLTSV